MQTLDNLAGYILCKFQGNITPMKLQKLLYYVKVWTTVSDEQVIPKNNSQAFYAWKFGPVNPGIYHNYKQFGKNPIEQSPAFTPPHGKEKKIIDFILGSYGSFSAVTLSKTTHTEDPWIKHKDSSGKISDKDIIEYYSKESFANNFPLGKSDKYFPPKTSSHYAYVFDMDENDDASEVTFSSLDEYLQIFNKAAKTLKFNSGILE